MTIRFTPGSARRPGSSCGLRNHELSLADRVFRCECGLELDRDHNAAVNLATWGEQHHAQVREPEVRAPVINARRREGSGSHRGVGETGPDDAGTDTHADSA